MLRPKNKTRILSIIHLALFMPWIAILLFVSVPVNGSARQETPGRTSKRIERVRRSQDTSIAFQNSAETPLAIQVAKAKEISGITYQKLTGASTALNEYTSFPTVTIINNRHLRVIGFTLAIRNQVTDRIHVVKVSAISIEPGDKYTLTANRWVRSDHQAQVTLEGGEIKSELAHVPLDLDSAKMWLPGFAKDLHMVVGIVEYADGSQWSMKPDK